MMMRTALLPLAVASLGLLACSGSEADQPGSTPPESEAIDFDELARLLVERAQPQPGERVLLVAHGGPYARVIQPLRTALAAAGAVDLGVLGVGEPDTDFASRAAGMSRQEMVDHFSDVDLGIMLPGPTPADPAYAALQDVLRSGRGRTIHFHWAGAYGLDGQLLENDARVDVTYQRSLLETDYAALDAAQASFEEALRTGEARVTTPAGTDLRFRIGDRPVTRQNGDASAARAARARNLIDREIELPAGALRVAPIEESVHGTIVFPPSVWGSEEVVGLTLTFEAGRVIDMAARQGIAAVEAELDGAGPAGRAFREFALGFNPTLAIPTEGERWIPYYGYGDAVVRLSLGDNSELGGAVTGGYVRWNFFTDATVTVGDRTWVRGGRLVDGP